MSEKKENDKRENTKKKKKVEQVTYCPLTFKTSSSLKSMGGRYRGLPLPSPVKKPKSELILFTVKRRGRNLPLEYYAVPYDKLYKVIGYDEFLVESCEKLSNDRK